jgi:hypothetical protein
MLTAAAKSRRRSANSAALRWRPGTRPARSAAARLPRAPCRTLPTLLDAKQ